MPPLQGFRSRYKLSISLRRVGQSVPSEGLYKFWIPQTLSKRRRHSVAANSLKTRLSCRAIQTRFFIHSLTNSRSRLPLAWSDDSLWRCRFGFNIATVEAASKCECRPNGSTVVTRGEWTKPSLRLAGSSPVLTDWVSVMGELRNGRLSTGEQPAPRRALVSKRFPTWVSLHQSGEDRSV